MGEVFRKQDHGDTRPEHPRENEYLQAGFELFAREEDADAEVFTLFAGILRPYRLSAVMGDMSLVLEAVRAAAFSGAPRHALALYLAAQTVPRLPCPLFQSRPAPRFRRGSRNLDRSAQPRGNAGPHRASGCDCRRNSARARMVGASSASAVDHRLRPRRPGRIARGRPRASQIAPAVERLAKRLDRIAALGVDTAAIRFDASHGRQSMEYYDGMTFSFFTHRADWPPVASGGRYDALTQVLGQGREIPAVGGIIRPGLLAELEAQA
ncbi:ATP phosphoribosyltransferase regulatory subunit [Paracoccus cavernae]|uniref:ATP phosphoribosyltransferase regulatory subunit n=1 Tax=Paracoccus cavernae TaxID=1571207 RepID=UPI00362DD8B0